MLMIYLAGSVPKGDKEAKNYISWRYRYKRALKQIFDASFIDPYRSDKDEGDPKAIFGEDCAHIKKSDLIIVNAEEKLGAGTAMEIVIAKYFKKPVITILPKDSHHRRTNLFFGGKLVADWIHPFIHSFSDFILESVNEINSIKKEIFKKKTKDLKVINDAIKYAESLEIKQLK